MAENQDATPTPASEPSALELAQAHVAQSTSQPDAPAQPVPSGESPSTGAVDWGFDTNGPMKPDERLLAEAANLSPEARAALERYVKGSQELYGKHYSRSLQGAAGGLPEEAPPPDLGPEEDRVEDPVYDPDDETPEQVEANRRWALKTLGLDPEHVDLLKQGAPVLQEIVAERQAASAEAQLDAHLAQYGPEIISQVEQETGGWKPEKETIRKAALLFGAMPEHLRPPTFGELVMQADPKGYAKFLTSRQIPGPEMAGESSSAPEAKPLETGTGSVFAAASRALGLG